MSQSNKLNKVVEYLNNHNITFQEDYLIKYDTWFKMGGNIKVFISPQSYTKLKLIISFLNNQHIEYKVIGFTSNVLFLDEIEYSIIISTKNLTYLSISDNIVLVDAGYSLQDFVRVAIMHQAKGYEGLEGIPGSIGGGIFMNAGAYNDCISDNLQYVECINKNNEIIILKKNECNFKHRDSIFKNNEFIILRASFIFNKGNREIIEKNVEKFHIARHSYQEWSYPNLGSMISLTGDIYHKILKKNSFYLFLYWILKIIYKNPVSKFINRKSPNNKIFNSLMKHYLIAELQRNISYLPSKKNVNILINDGTINSKEIIDFIFFLHDLINKEFKIENEIIINPVHSMDDEFRNIYKKIRDKLKSLK